MPERRKDKKLDTIHLDRFRTNYDLYLRPDNTFLAMWKGERIAAAPSADACRREAFKFLDERLALTWQKAISISFPRDNHAGDDDSTVRFRFERLLVARREHDGRWLSERWADDLDDEEEAKYRTGQELYLEYRGHDAMGRQLPPGPLPTALPFVSTPTHGEAPKHYLPYSDEVWETLQEIRRRLVELKRRLRDLVAEPGLATLVGMMRPALEARRAAALAASETPALPAPEGEPTVVSTEIAFSVDPSLIPTLLAAGLATPVEEGVPDGR